MNSTARFRRSALQLNDQSFPVIMTGRKAWLFIGSEPIRLPTYLTKWPGLLSWGLRNYLEPPPNTTLWATVIPQMGCNAACGYCFQNVSVTETSVERVDATWMTDKVMEATVVFIEKERLRKGLDGVHVGLFGGEPLLNPERCYKLLEMVEHRVGASIISNGIRLTPEIAQGLTERGVSSIQITFDGAREDHDQVRVLAANRDGTYDTILDNLVQIDALPVLPSRQLRVNVTQKNIGNLEALVRDLADKLEPSRWLLYFAVVDDIGAGWAGGLTPGRRLADTLIGLSRLAQDNGFKIAPPSAGRECGFCSQSFGDGGMVVNADGQLSSCWETAGFPTMVVGNVWSGYKPAGNEHKWVQCGYQSVNQGSIQERAGDFEELDWALRELAVERALAKSARSAK